jgi:signal transduction histidine kinase
MQTATSVDLTHHAAGAYPDAIDTRLVLRIYAWLAVTGGLYAYAWPIWAQKTALPLRIDGMPWALYGIVRTDAALIVGSGVCALAIAIIEDPAIRRRALVRFAIAHLIFGFLWFLQWFALFDTVVPAPIGWLPLTIGTVLLYVGLTAPTGTRMRRPVMSYGPYHDRPLRSVDSLRSQYEDQIRRAAQQEERARLARDLHDAVKQQLFVVHTAAATAETRLATDEGAVRQAIGQIRTAAREATSELQAMIEQLQAAPIENVGLADALKKQCEALEFRTGAVVRLTIHDLPPSESLPPGTQRALFRAAQEALANVARHARARHVVVTLRPASERLELLIADDGAGFDPATTPRGMGINNMMARVHELGGWFSLKSRPGEGTTVELTVPYSVISPWQYGWQALAYGSVLGAMFVTWRLKHYGFANSPLLIISAALTGVIVARNVVALLKLRRRRTAS